jgi:archaellum component FlaC
MKNENSINKITLEDVLKVTKDSFGSLQKDITDIKSDSGELKERVTSIEENMENIATKDDIVRIEHNHERRIEILEDDVRVLKTTVEKR